MMLPSLIPTLRRYRDAIGSSGVARRSWGAVVVGAGYFFVWAAVGMACFPAGVALAAVAMEQPPVAHAVPMAAGLTVLVAGAVQFTAWKMRHLAWCRAAPAGECAMPVDAATAWRHGVRLGVHCSQGCANLMAILLVVGVIDPGAMTCVTAAISLERLAPAAGRVARVIGAIAVAAGLFLMTRAIP
jgi:predicted metal-binding membrane protein